ncbi:MAG TPA: SMP-30/gluconolactonase/LRE family protein [Candidatus Binatia bacterium]|jgi:gluconolactonase
MKLVNCLIAIAMLVLPLSRADAQLADKKALTLAAAEKIAAAAETEAHKRNATVVIVVADDGGYPLVLKRLDDTQVASVEVGIGKARTAAIFRRPSREFEEQIKNGRVASLVLPGATPLQGGVPLIFGGKVIGAIGVSGNTPQEDEEIAKAGAAAFASGIASSNESDETRNKRTANAPDEWLGKRKPDAMIDLATREGVRLVKGAWRYSDTKIIDVDFKAAGSDGQPSGTPNRTYDFTPHAGGADFDDSKWETFEPTTLEQRRSAGKLAFSWYRINITVPERIGDFDPTDTTAVFATSLDDYAEIWVDGELARAPGQSGGSVIKGWNAENRLIVGRNVKPGQKIQLAIFGINGPISNPPTNYIYIRYAKLEFHRVAAGPVALTPQEVNVEVVRVDPAFDAIVPANPKIFKLAEGFQFTEGPVETKPGELLFSDPNANRIYRYTAGGTLSVFKENSGYSGKDVAEYGQPGSNGLTVDPQGRLTINEHGNRRVTRLERDGKTTVVADRYEGKRLNSPNDLVYRSDGTLYFTDPPFGLPKFYDDPRKELPFSGVFAVYRGNLRLVTTDLKGPNGIALSPDEKYLYVGNWDPEKKVIMRYDVAPDAKLSNGKVFFDMTSAPGEDAIDGIKVDQQGNLYVSGPGGLWVISGEGKHLGTIRAPRHPHNLAWGGEDGKTLYLTAQSALYRMPLNIPGVRPTSGIASAQR